MTGTVGFGGQLKRVLYDKRISPEVIDFNDDFDTEELNTLKDINADNYYCLSAKHRFSQKPTDLGPMHKREKSG